MSTLLDDVVWADLDMESVLDNSYKDFHAKGIDYLCLHRDPGLTLKAYFFESGAQDAGEVVNPHDHRYDFNTQCISGVIRNKWYRDPPCFDGESHKCGDMYNAFAWHTPLLGGSGFSRAGAWPLQEYKFTDFHPGRGYFMAAEEFHTIQVMQPETVIVLAQYEDKVPPNQPTFMFAKSSEPPDLSGLYNKFTADQAVKRIDLLQELLCRI